MGECITELPVVSIVMPHFNRGDNLECFMENIRKQTYPTDKLEVVLGDFCSKDNTAEVAEKYGCVLIRDDNPDMEYRRTLAIKSCKGEYIFIADDDNFFVNPNLILEMVEIIQKEVVGGVQCIWEYYDKTDWAINRLCAIYGTTDPATYYLRMQDHMPVWCKKWILNGQLIKETNRFYKVRFEPDEIPTMGCQGFLCKKEDALAAEKNGLILHMDICHNLAQHGHGEFVFVKDYFGHHHVQNTKQLMKKLARNINRFNIDGKERNMNYNMSFLKMIRLGLIMGTFIIPMKDAIVGFIYTKDYICFAYPVICFRVTLLYTMSTLSARCRRKRK